MSPNRLPFQAVGHLKPSPSFAISINFSMRTSVRRVLTHAVPTNVVPRQRPYIGSICIYATKTTTWLVQRHKFPEILHRGNTSRVRHEAKLRRNTRHGICMEMARLNVRHANPCAFSDRVSGDNCNNCRGFVLFDHLEERRAVPAYGTSGRLILAWLFHSERHPPTPLHSRRTRTTSVASPRAVLHRENHVHPCPIRTPVVCRTYTWEEHEVASL